MMKIRIAFCICALFLLCILPVPAFAAETEYAALIDPVAQEMIGKTVPGACVVISESGKIAFSKGYGCSDMEHLVKMDPRKTVFEWGSISKTFVWVSIMQMEEKGAVDLTEDIRTYLPKGFLKNLRYEEPITLLHLMNHTAGFEEQMLNLRFYQPEEDASLYAFIGLIPGSIGETSVIAIAIGAVVLLVTRIASHRTMLSVFVGGILTAFLFNAAGIESNEVANMDWTMHIVTGGFCFGAVFMATDPVTSARTEKGQYIYGFLIGAMAILIRVLNPGYPEGMMLAILLMNMFAPLIDYCFVQSNINKRLKRASK